VQLPSLVVGGTLALSMGFMVLWFYGFVVKIGAPSVFSLAGFLGLLPL
jgi:hypothetical protein